MLTFTHLSLVSLQFLECLSSSRTAQLNSSNHAANSSNTLVCGEEHVLSAGEADPLGSILDGNLWQAAACTAGRSSVHVHTGDESSDDTTTTGDSLVQTLDTFVSSLICYMFVICLL